MRGAFFRRGQNLADLALIIGVVGLAFIGMEAYIRRGVQGKVKDLTDYIISDKQSAGEDAVDSNTSFSLDSTMESKEFKGGGRRLTGNEDSTSTYSQKAPPAH
ncbi:MAG: hypothetical protein NTX01_01080 [Candidatus Omnitrophica bacterium]|nr:hypothetical protein [Candidatus Omnitrophota bacterium]